MVRQPTLWGEAVRDIRDIYEAANRRMAGVVAESIEAGSSAGVIAVHSTFRSGVEKQLAWLRGEHESYVSHWVPSVYARQLKVVGSQIEGAGLLSGAARFGSSMAHEDVVSILGNNLLGALDGNANLMAQHGAKILEDSILSAAAIGRRGAPLVEQTARQLASARALGFEFTREISGGFRSVALQAITEGALEGDGVRLMKNRMVELFQERGLPAFVDRGGKTWTLDSYAEMVSRTTLREASTQATIRGLLEVGLDVVEVIGSSSWPDSPCIPYEEGGAWGGRLSLTGKTPGIPTLAEAQANGFQHPNCIHTIAMYPDQEPRDDITPRDAERAMEESSARKVPQITDQAKPMTSPPSNIPVSLPAPRRPRPDGSIPVGNKVSLMSHVRPGRNSTAIQRALAITDRVHGFPSTEKAVIRTSFDRENSGTFGINKRTGQPYIGVSVYGDHPELTTLHETGHWLDLLGHGNKSAFSSLNDPLFRGWREAVFSSSAVTELNAMQQLKSIPTVLPNGKTVNRIIDKKKLAYYLLHEEIFARSYAQYIAIRSGDDLLLNQLNKMRDEVGNIFRFRQWSDADFEPIAQALDELMEKAGWLKKTQ